MSLLDMLLGQKVEIQVACKASDHCPRQQKEWRIHKTFRLKNVPHEGETLIIPEIGEKIVNVVAILLGKKGITILACIDRPILPYTSDHLCSQFGWSANSGYFVTPK